MKSLGAGERLLLNSRGWAGAPSEGTVSGEIDDIESGVVDGVGEDKSRRRCVGLESAKGGIEDVSRGEIVEWRRDAEF